jgi:C4-dicarboxylate-specific signal transduction histidine kinase
VRESLAMVAPDARRKQVAIDAPAPTEPCAVKGDPVLLQQVMVNVLMNAIEAMAETPPDRRRIQVHQQVERHGVTISIRDAGTGLPASIDGQLFEPFVTTKTNGIGIGLTIAKAIVDSHGGSLDAHNNPDGGATFAMTLPRDAKPESAGLVAASL